MNYNLNAVNFNIKKNTIELINKKIEKIKKYNLNIIRMDVNLKLESEKEIKNKEVAIVLQIKGQNDIVVRKREENFEKALEFSIDSITKTIRRLKEKIATH